MIIGTEIAEKWYAWFEEHYNGDPEEYESIVRDFCSSIARDLYEYDYLYEVLMDAA
jgi:hypothetical protein